MLTVGSLFSGIGGLDLGLERAGMRVVWQVESNDYCRTQLAAHWPDVARYGDVREVDDLPAVDIIAGGFPCQPVSHAGKGLGPSDPRWLWPQFARIVRLVRPRYVLVENVPGLLAQRGMGSVLGDLAALGFDAEWSVLSACSLGAPQTRERLFILAYPHAEHGKEGLGIIRHGQRPLQAVDGQAAPEHVWLAGAPHLDRLADGPTDGVAVAAAGNAVVPQVAEWIGCQIMNAEARR